MKKSFEKKIVAVALAAAVTLLLPAAVRQVDAGRAEAGRTQLEDALRRAAVACYATEGAYPPTVDYLQAHYGIRIDKTRYAVFYEVFAENLMPEITVLLKES